MTSPTESPPEPQRARRGSAAGLALVLVAAECLATARVGVREPGLYLGGAGLLFVAGWLVFALPIPRRAPALGALVALGAFHAAFAGHEADRRLDGLEFGLLAAQALVLGAAFLHTTRAATSDTHAERRLRWSFATGALLQAWWCASFLYPSTDASPVWVGFSSAACTALAPALGLLALRRWTDGRTPRAAVGLALLAVLPLAAGRAVFWRAHRQALGALVTHQAPRRDVLLIVLDTVRADRMSLYGHARATTPELERFAARATVYEQAQSQAVWTLPGHASLFTGLYPSEHQAEWKDGVAWLRKLDESALTLAERFALDGYRTACLAANAFLGSELGLAQGFQWVVTGRSPSVYLTAPALVMGLASAWDGPRGRQRIGPFERGSTLHATELNALALEWLARTAGAAPRFLVLNYMEAHDPLRLRPCGTPRFGDGRACVPDNLAETDAVWAGRASVAPESARRLADWYDSALACLDRHLGELFEALEARGLLEGMVVAVTADHGHLLGEHDAFDHEAEVWRELTHVPLVLKHAGQTAGARCSEPVETASLATVLPWLAGLGPPLALDGPDSAAAYLAARFPAGPPPSAPLCPLLAGTGPTASEAPERHDLAQDNPRFATRWTALVDGGLKFFVDGADRIQVAELAGSGPEVLREPTPAELARALALLESWRAGLLAPLRSTTATSEGEAEAAERLRLLQHQGYAGG